MLPEEAIQNILCALEGTDQILQKLSTKKKTKKGQGSCETTLIENILLRTLMNGKLPPQWHQVILQMLECPSGLWHLPALLSLLGFSRVRRGPVANITEHHCMVDAVGL